MNLRERLNRLVHEENTTLKEVIEKSGMSYNGFHNKLTRNTVYVRDLEKILDVLGMKLAFVPKSENKSQRK